MNTYKITLHAHKYMMLACDLTHSTIFPKNFPNTRIWYYHHRFICACHTRIVLLDTDRWQVSTHDDDGISSVTQYKYTICYCFIKYSQAPPQLLESTTIGETSLVGEGTVDTARILLNDQLNINTTTTRELSLTCNMCPEGRFFFCCCVAVRCAVRSLSQIT